MRAITKSDSGHYHLKNKKKSWKSWDSFRGEPKRMVMAALLSEQYQLCCYSELRADLEGLGYHIEHVENKSKNSERTFDYTNLAASAFSSDALAKWDRSEVFGGHAARKQGHPDAIDSTKFISPHAPDCARYFAYLLDGRIAPREGLNTVDNDRARYTIDTLNLNSDYLLFKREQWRKALEGFWAEHEEKDWSQEHLIRVLLEPTNNALNNFFSLTRQFFGPKAEVTLRQYAHTLV